MHNNDILKLQYNQSSCKDARLFSYGQMTSPSFKAKVPKNAEKQITDETLKIASAAIAASGIVYLANRSKLTKEQQEEIIEKYRQGHSTISLATEYECSKLLIQHFLKKQPNINELKKENKANRMNFSTEQIVQIIERYINGESCESISKDYDCSTSTINLIINHQPNAEELKKQSKEKRTIIDTNMHKQILERFVSGETYETIAKDYDCSKNTIMKIIDTQDNADELKKQSRENRLLLDANMQKQVIERFANGESVEAIAKDYNCSLKPIKRIINKQTNVEELKEQHKRNKALFSLEEQNKIIERFINGESYESIAKVFNCSSTTISKIIKTQPNADDLIAKNKENKQYFTKEQQDEIVKSFSEGKAIDAIARMYNCNYVTVRRFIFSHPNSEQLIANHQKNRKINYRRVTFTKEQQAEIIKNFEEGKSYEMIANTFKCSTSTIKRFLLNHPNSEQLFANHQNNMKIGHSKKFLTQEQKDEVINRYSKGESCLAIAASFNCSESTISMLIRQHFSSDYILNKKKANRDIFSDEDKEIIIARYKSGETIKEIAKDYNRSELTIRKIIVRHPTAEEISILHKQNIFAKTLRGQPDDIIKHFRDGKTYSDIARTFDCSYAHVRHIINEQPNFGDILAEHRSNSSFFNENQMQDIFQRLADGETYRTIAIKYNCSISLIWKIVQAEHNKNKEGTTKETFWHKYEKYSIDELKTRISEFVSLKQVEENDELLEIMFFLDEKAKFDEDEKALSIDFIRLLDKLEQQKASTKNVIESQTVKDLFDLMDKDLIKQQVFEELNKDYNAAIDELNLTGNEALGDICSKYIAHNIDDEDNIASMKTILNIISSNDEKAIRHKLVTFDNMKQNPNDERIKEAEEIYGEDNQEKIGQYIIFDQVLKGEYTNADFDNDACKFVDVLKDMHLNKDAIIKRLIELEDYFNSEEGKNNSLTNFIKCFNSNDNYINKLLTDFYIDNIYKDKVTTIEVIPNSMYFSGKNVTLMIYPEAKQATLENTEVNFDKHLFLIDSEEYARNFATKKLGSLGVKIFTLDKSYQKEGFYSGENVLEIKVPNGYNGARLAAKIKNEDNRVFEIKYFMPKGFHREKKRTDL